MKILTVAAVAEAATGVALMVVPSLIGRLLLGTDLVGVSVVVARVAGIALLALGVGCWPGPASRGMLTYSVLVTVYLGYLALGGAWKGPLLWPVVALHAVITVLLGPRGGKTKIMNSFFLEMCGVQFIFSPRIHTPDGKA